LRHNARPALLLGRPSGPLRARATYGEGEAKTTTTNTTKRQQRWLPLTAPTRKRPRRSGGGWGAQKIKLTCDYCCSNLKGGKIFDK